jgi:hypothetical protein
MSYVHCRQRAPVGNALSSSGTSQLSMFDIQATTKSKYYDHIVLLYLESRSHSFKTNAFNIKFKNKIKLAVQITNIKKNRTS